MWPTRLRRDRRASPSFASTQAGDSAVIPNPFGEPPYFDLRIDRWKVTFVILLFFLLLVGALLWPA